MAEKTLSLAGTAAVGFLMESSPRLQSTMDAPLANPMYLSDAPNFIQRQRTRAAKALVSEHVSTVTCGCRQCHKAARSRLVPESGLPWPPSMKNFVGEWAPGGAVPSTAPPGPAGDRGPLPPTATKLDEARKQIRYAREAHELQEPVETSKGKIWREAAFRHHRCLAELRAREQELAQLQAASLSRTNTEETLGTLTRKQQEVDRVATTATEAEEALDRVDAEYQDSEGEMTGTLTSDNHSLHSATMQPKGFVWFLRVAAACARAEEAPVPDYYADLEQKGNSRPANNLESFIPAEGQSGSLEDVLGIRIPDTVILQKGKPQRRYTLDAQGRVQVTHMKTSAELLRVLRDFVRRAIRPRLPAANLALQAMGGSKGAAGFRKTSSFVSGLPPASAGTQPAPSKTAPQRSRSEGALKGRVALGSISDILGPGGGHATNPMTEVAVLYYSADEDEQPEELMRSRTYVGQTRAEEGGRLTAVRLMTYAEAIAQMKGASKLPRAFWQHIGILQTPVQSSHVGVPTRYITYNYDQALAGEIDPQEPVPLGGLQPGQDPVPRDEASRVAAVPRKVNEHLLRCKKGQYYLSLVSGQFEFVLDEADGTLWLVNASKLVIERRQEAKKKDPKVEEVRYFEEEEFAQLMREEDLRLSQNMKRFVNQDPATPKSPDGMPTFTLNAADRLANVRVPQALYTFYAAEHEMLRYYKEEVLPVAEKKPGSSDGRGKAVSLHSWFRWWARAAGIKGRRAMRRRNDVEDGREL